MIVKIYTEKGAKTKRVGGRGLTLARIVVTIRILEEYVQKGKEIVKTEQEQGKIGHRYCSALIGSVHYEGERKWRSVILTLVSLYTERETYLFSLLKGDMPQ
jgi:hypothetical protein